MSAPMKNLEKKVLPFPTPPDEPGISTITVQIGSERFAIHWEVEELPPLPPLLPLLLRKRPDKKTTAKS
jgi:hypothetical protein